jgi:hypothetical protein
MPEPSPLELVRHELERTGLYKHFSVKCLYGRMADLNPSEAAHEALKKAWGNPDDGDGETIIKMVLPLLSDRALGNTLINAARRGPLWLLEATWDGSPAQARADALAEAASTRNADSSVWLLSQEGFPPEILQNSLTQGLIAKHEAWVQAALEKVEKPWKSIPKLRNRASGEIAFLDEQWAKALQGAPHRRPSSRFMSALLHQELPLVGGVLREATLEQRLPVPHNPRPKPRF